MSNKCTLVVFSDKAYNGIIRESFAKHPVETGGILLGHILDNGVWIVLEMIPPGINCIHEIALFEYDQNFVNYLGTSIANQYQVPLSVLGLWHRHPGSMDYFSSTDDVTNSNFASQNPYGTISGLVNIDPKLRLTMYHLDSSATGENSSHLTYSKIPIEIGDDLIPEKYFALRYIDAERSNLNPTPSSSNNQPQIKVQQTYTNHSEEFGETNNPNTTTTKTNTSKLYKLIIASKPIMLLGLVLLFSAVLFGAGYYCGNLRAPIKVEDKQGNTNNPKKDSNHSTVNPPKHTQPTTPRTSADTAKTSNNKQDNEQY